MSVISRQWRPRNIYSALIVVRTCFAIFGPGYIHPDEYFQNGEVIAGRISGLHALKTWEWDPAFPCRSILPPALTTGLPLQIWKAILGGHISPSIIFSVERLSFLLLSFVLDYCIAELIPNGGDRTYALFLFASSYVTHTFQVRPFSNSIETVLVALSMVALRNLVSIRHTENRRGTLSLASLAILLVFGAFTRLTSVAFMLPIGLQALKWTLKHANAGRSFLSMTQAWLHLIILPLFAAGFAMLGLVLADTLYFRGNVFSLVLTPLNFLSYNITPSNLAAHGVHPRWLHVVVNLPMIVGPGLLYYGLVATRDMLKTPHVSLKTEEGVVETMKKTSLYMIISSLAILSILPHQEPRFLTPLLVPFIVLVAQSGHIHRAGKLFWISWIVGNITLSILFGFLHQGGVVRSLFHIHHLILPSGTNVQSVLPEEIITVVYWKTYMPPWHLLGIQEEDVLSGRYSLVDLAGVSSDVLLKTLTALSNTATFLAAPLYAMRKINERRNCFLLKERVFPHLDLDNIPELLEVGLKSGLTLGIYAVDAKCLDSYGTT